MRGRNDAKTDRTYKIIEIQGEKEQLQKEMEVLKSKINELKESSKIIAEHQQLKKNSELISDRLTSLVEEIAPNIYSSSKKSSDVLIEFIKSKVLHLINHNEQLEKVNQKLKGKN